MKLLASIVAWVAGLAVLAVGAWWAWSTFGASITSAFASGVDKLKSAAKSKNPGGSAGDGARSSKTPKTSKGTARPSVTGDVTIYKTDEAATNVWDGVTAGLGVARGADFLTRLTDGIFGGGK